MIVIILIHAAHAAFYSTIASSLIGQPDFTQSAPNNGGISASSLNIPRGVAYNSQYTLYGIDSSNHRVLKYPAGSGVYGQNGLYTTNAPSAGANGLRFPSQIAINSVDGALIADGGNHRVLYYPSATTTASLVFGQPDFFSTTANQGLTQPTAQTLYAPRGLTVDENDNFYLADWLNHRVLFFRAADYLQNGNTTPAFVYGQDDFNSAVFGTGTNRFYGPNVVTYSRLLNSLIVADTGNHRVLFFAPGNTNAYRVIGQPDFVQNTANNGGRSEWTLNGPYGIAVDSIGGVLVSDSGNHRVTYYLPDRNDALLLFGQPDFTEGLPNNGGISQTSIFQSIGIAIAAEPGILSIADMGNNRILQFPIINTVLRNQTVVFPNGGVVASNSTLDVKGELLVQGNMTVDGALIVDRTIVNITQDLQISNATLQVFTDATGPNVEIVVARYTTRSTTSVFSSIQVESCSNVRPVYGLSTLTLLVDCGQGVGPTGTADPVDPSSASPRSNTTVIIAVAVSCSVVIGVTVGILIVVYYRKSTAARTKIMKEKLKKQEMSNLNPQFQHGEN